MFTVITVMCDEDDSPTPLGRVVICGGQQGTTNRILDTMDRYRFRWKRTLVQEPPICTEEEMQWAHDFVMFLEGVPA